MDTTFVKQHFKLLEDYLAGRSRLCQSQLPSVDIGTNREFFLHDILKRHLPSFCEITTGCLCDAQAVQPTGQIDLVLFNPLSMRMNVGATDCCPAEGVYSVVEVKSSVNEEHFKSSIHKFEQVAALKRSGLYTNMLGYMDPFEEYHFNTIGTVLFAYSGYLAQNAVEKVRELAVGAAWSRRPELIYSLDRAYLLVRDDYGIWNQNGKDFRAQPSWIHRVASAQQLRGYVLIDHDPLLCLCIALSKRIQCNYHLLPTFINYVASIEES